VPTIFPPENKELP